MKDKNFVWKFDPKVYPIGNIFSIAQSFVDKAYVTVDGDPNERMAIQMRAKYKSTDLNALKKEFNLKIKNELQAAEIRVLPSFIRKSGREPSYLDDPYKIAVPFEKRFGKKK